MIRASKTSTLVTVAACCALDQDWKGLEQKWMDILSSAWVKASMPTNITPFLHATDLMAPGSKIGKPYNRGKWTEQSKLDLLESCAVALMEMSQQQKLHMVTCSAWLEDYNRAVVAIPEMPHLVDQMVTWCIGRIAITDGNEFVKDGLATYFDPNEKIFGKVLNRFEYKKAKLTFPWNRVTSMGVSNSSVTPGLQFPDLLAWCINASYAGKLGTLWQEHLFSYRRYSKMLNLGKIGSLTHSRNGGLDRE